MPRDTRLALALGVGISVLVTVAVLTGWPPDSSVAASAGGQVERALAWARIFSIAQIVAFALFFGALLVVRRDPPRTAVVIGVAVVIQLLPLAGPMILGTDGWSYWNVGRITTVLDGNPYLDVPAAFPADVSTAYVYPFWQERVTPYGPGWVAASSAVAFAAGDSADLGAWLFRAVAAISMVLLTVMVSRGSPRPALAAVFVGWNPVFAMQYAGAGHNDAFMAALVVAGLLAATVNRHRIGGLAWALAIAVKWLPLVLIPLQLVHELARKGRSITAWTLVSLAVIGIVATIVFGFSWVEAVRPIIGNATEGVTSVAIWPRLERWAPGAFVRIAPLVLFGLAYTFLLWQAWRGRTRRGLAAGLFLAASPALWSWYLILPASLSAYEDDGLGMSLATVMIAYAGLLHITDVGWVFELFL